MTDNPIDTELASFHSDDVTVRLCHAIFGSVPFAPKLPPYRTLEEATRVLYPAATPQTFARVRELAQGEPVKGALWMSNVIDTGDTGIAIYSGVKSALGLFFGDNKIEALETDTQQGVDCGLKLLGISYLVHKLFQGSLSQKAQSFYATPSGQATAFYYASIEVALPFTDNVVMAGGSVIQTLVNKYGDSAVAKMAALPGGAQIANEAKSMVGSLMGPFEGAVAQVAPHARAIADATVKFIPGFMNAADKVAGVVATGADALPVYRYLGARLAAEACVLQASRGQ